MKTILLAVDDTKGAERAAETLAGWAKVLHPESVIVLHVQQMWGRSLVGEGLVSDPDIQEVSKALEGTEFLEKLDAASAKIVAHFTALLQEAGYRDVRTLIRKGHPAEQILETAKEEDVELIVLGSRGKRLHTLLLGSVSREIANTSDISVLTVH
ncbi:MAG: universal stress protein [Pseudomonadota bacterium]|nr:MAG: universal stress protein [Pseudomonadota bacterium]